MPGPREYKRSTIFALAALGQGSCYWPDPQCNVPVVVYIADQPVTNLEIAHICAAEPGGPRYLEHMSDEDRRSWPNLLLLCTPHHNIIDKIRPGDYSIEELQRWKSNREAGGLAKLKGLADLTENRLREMLTYSIQESYKEVRELLAEHKQIDPDAALLLHEASRHLNMDTAETFHRASRLLAPALYDYGEILYRAARQLAPALYDYGGVLDQASRTLAPALNNHADDLAHVTKHLPALLEALDQSIRELRRLQRGM